MTEIRRNFDLRLRQNLTNLQARHILEAFKQHNTNDEKHPALTHTETTDISQAIAAAISSWHGTSPRAQTWALPTAVGEHACFWADSKIEHLPAWQQQSGFPKEPPKIEEHLQHKAAGGRWAVLPLFLAR